MRPRRCRPRRSRRWRLPGQLCRSWSRTVGTGLTESSSGMVTVTAVTSVTAGGTLGVPVRRATTTSGGWSPYVSFQPAAPRERAKVPCSQLPVGIPGRDVSGPAATGTTSGRRDSGHGVSRMIGAGSPEWPLHRSWGGPNQQVGESGSPPIHRKSKDQHEASQAFHRRAGP